MPTPQYNLYKHRQGRQNVSAFAALIETPVNGAVTLPANARIGLRRPSVSVAGTTMATVAGPTNRTIGSPGLAADEIMVLDRLERGSVVTPTLTVEVLIDTGLGVWRMIAQGA